MVSSFSFKKKEKKELTLYLLISGQWCELSVEYPDCTASVWRERFECGLKLV